MDDSLSSLLSEQAENFSGGPPSNENINIPSFSSLFPDATKEIAKDSPPQRVVKIETLAKSEKRLPRRSTTILNSHNVKDHNVTQASVIDNTSHMRGEEHEQAEKNSTKGKRSKSILELKILAKKWIDELFEMTVDIPQKVTKEMLDLRMCIDLARFGEHLTEGQEDTFRQAVKKVSTQKGKA